MSSSWLPFWRQDYSGQPLARVIRWMMRQFAPRAHVKGERKVMLHLKGRGERLEEIFSVWSARGVDWSNAKCMWAGFCGRGFANQWGQAPLVTHQLHMGNNSLVFNRQEKRVENKLNCSQRNQPGVYVMANGYFKGQQGMSLEQGADYAIGLNLDMHKVLERKGYAFKASVYSCSHLFTNSSKMCPVGIPTQHQANRWVRRKPHCWMADVQVTTRSLPPRMVMLLGPCSKSAIPSPSSTLLTHLVLNTDTWIHFS